MNKLNSSSLAAILTYTSIEDNEDIDSFDGVVLSSPQAGTRYEQTTFNITLFNSKLKIKYSLPGEMLTFNAFLSDIKSVICANSMNTSRWVFLSNKKFSLGSVIASVERTSQLDIYDAAKDK